MEKIVFSDVDGTLIGHDFYISDEINHHISNFNGKFVVATGRMYDTAKELNFEKNCDMICSNGSELIIDGEIKYQTTMKKNMAIEIVKKLLVQKKYLNIYTTTGVYVPNYDGLLSIIMEETQRYATGIATSIDEYKEYINTHLNLFYYTNEIVDDIFTIIANSEVIKIEIVDCHDVQASINTLETDYNITAYSSFGNNLEIVPKGITKVTGITRYINHHNITNAQTFAIGDGRNDIEMLKNADVAIAMGNAHDELKAVADHIVANQNNGGMLEAFNIINSY